MGARDAFADIPNYCNVPQYISKMFQVAKIKMDEEGTEAAAVTVESLSESVQHEPKFYEFHADCPFLYIISEQSTGVILFIGQYMGENTTGIEQLVESSKELVGSPIHNLSGQRLSKMQKGINIVGGRKILHR